MRIINTISKVTPEKISSNNIPKLTFMDTLQKRISQVKNTHLEFNGKYINITTDITRLSKGILVYQINTESESLKKSDSSAKEKNKDISDKLDKRLKEWYESEKITAPPSIIYRETDKEAEKTNIKLSDKVKKEILDLINEKYINISTLEKKASVISMMNPLKSDETLNKKINMMGVKKELINDIKKEAPEEFRFLVEHFHKNDGKKQNEELLTPEELFVYHDIPIVREITGKMVSDVYYSIIENIYSTLFHESKTEKNLDFLAIKKEIKTEIENEIKRQSISSEQKKTSTKESSPDDKKRKIAEDVIRCKFYSEIKVTSYSPEKEREKLFETLDKSQRNESLSDQRATFNPAIKSASSSSEEELENLFDILEKNQSISDISDQRAALKNK